MVTVNRIPPFHQVFDELNRFFGDAMDVVAGWPRMDLSGDEESLTVRVELPGVEMADIDLSLESRVLTLSGERKLPEAGEDAQWILRERDTGSFNRSLRLPYDVEEANVAARAENGVLLITLPRRENSKPRRIAIEN